MLVTLPFVLLLLDYWPLDRSEGQKPDARRQILPLVIEKVPLLALSVASSIVTFLAQRGALGWTEQLPMSARINNAIVTYVVYLRQMFWPAKLAVFYLHPENRLPTWEVVLALLIVIGITVAGFVLRKRAPYLIVGWLWYPGACLCR